MHPSAISIPRQFPGGRGSLLRGLLLWGAVSVSGQVAALHALPSAAQGGSARGAEAASLQADCNDEALARVLAPAQGLLAGAAPQASAAPAASAYWLDSRLLLWPGQERRQAGAVADLRFRLLASQRAALDLVPGQVARGVDHSLALHIDTQPLPPALAQRFAFAGAREASHLRLRLAGSGAGGWSDAQLRELHRSQLVLAAEDAEGRLVAFSLIQHPGALDALFASAEKATLGVSFAARAAAFQTRFALWAPTAQAVHLCRYPGAEAPAHRVQALRLDARSGVWATNEPGDLSGEYTRYLVDVVVPGVGLVRNRVTDPYALSLNADSRRAYVARMDAPRFQPEGWAAQPAPRTVKKNTDMVIYELHVRDFSLNDAGVPEAHRGKFLGFTHPDSAGMRHLRALREAGLTDVHLLPVFDIASIPERGCVEPRIPAAAPDSPEPQAAVVEVAGRDCYNWGYDPFHYTAPEGSYSTDANDGAARILEFRRMVMALHQAGLRVGMDVVYNHTPASGQHAHSVLDRIVPGYYQRLNARGEVERSTCCDNTATEHRMMAKLMSDSVSDWVRHYRIDSFRFDLMGHQPRPVMEAMARRVKREAGHEVQMLGEGWNFGEVAHGQRFVQASQLSLNGSGIGTFSDRGRDALRGGGPGDMSEAGLRRAGYLHGLVDDLPAGEASELRLQALQAADMVRVALAGSLRDFTLTDHRGKVLPLRDIPYGDQPAGYVSQPGEVVNYTENHDNHTLFDSNVLRLPLATPMAERIRVQHLGAAMVALSQGIAYFHAGQELLRSKSMDRNSYDSGDWFNKLDLSYEIHNFGVGLPPAPDNRGQWPLYAPVLAQASLKATPADIRLAKDMFLDLLRLRASSSLFRMSEAAEVKKRLRFHDTGPAQNPALVVAELDGQGLVGANFRGLMVFINASAQVQNFSLPGTTIKWALHPVQARADAADARVREGARFEAAHGRFTVPARSAVVFVR
jgi:pullulanase/glycogen debranching enzyme